MRGRMVEFGSDFYIMQSTCYFSNDLNKNVLYEVYSDVREYANGRHALEALCKFKGWNRIWIPAYFCYEVIEYLKNVGIKVSLYDDHPLKNNDSEVVKNLPYKNGDVILRMNFFGIRGFRSNAGIGVPVIEDHTHDLLSEWAQKSDADYCIASVRKSMPIASGGILWSPRKLSLPEVVSETAACKAMAEERYEGMKMKRDFLLGKSVDKSVFRQKMLKTEELIDKLSLSGMDEKTIAILRGINYGRWDKRKLENWKLAFNLLSESFHVLDSIHPFSIIILCETSEERSSLRDYLIDNLIYPAILWKIPNYSEYSDARSFSERMLSIHCDARYSKTDITEMCKRILAFKK